MKELEEALKGLTLFKAGPSGLEKCEPIKRLNKIEPKSCKT